ncbi:hypothetical protein JWS13_39120 [Rhodococcus pseudokoreensis]|uniref:Scaffolding protein n=1 Tax=Rhodococcus pseudokoreensis TaxID=2811421 RepID=A0A974WAR9_9NOCA|nr:hypothetical protein [Rhodococcus pseudokoreensis]QSE94189.1 hypothetical protein JWS13_39120 [Rhodococcus pseudokoreensis]
MSSTILPIHAVTGLTALGLTKRGKPIWPVLGGNGEGDGDTDDKGPVDDDQDEEPDDEPDADTDDDPDEDEDRALGPKGEKALAAEKDKRKQERSRRITSVRENRQLKAQLAAKGKPKVKESDDDERERVIEERLTARANARIIAAEVRAAAAGKLSDPADAHRFLDLDQFEVTEDGEVDPDEIADAIDDLIKKKPYLAAQGGTRKAPKPDRRQGGGSREATGSMAAGRAAYQSRNPKKN